MNGSIPTRPRLRGLAVAALGLLAAAAVTSSALGAAPPKHPRLTPKFSAPVAFDVSLPLSAMAWQAPLRKLPTSSLDIHYEIRPERDVVDVKDQGYSGDGALQGDSSRLGPALAIPSPIQNFEGLCNQDNFDIFGFRVNPPDPVGDVGPNHYVEMINLVFGVYDKTGNLLLGPIDTGTLWAGFAGAGLHRPLGRPDRRLRPVRGSLAPDPVHHRRVPLTTTASPSRRRATRPAPTTATPSRPASTSRTTPSTGSGRNRT